MTSFELTQRLKSVAFQFGGSAGAPENSSEILKRQVAGIRPHFQNTII
jgi:hypothetical protein